MLKLKEGHVHGVIIRIHHKGYFLRHSTGKFEYLDGCVLLRGDVLMTELRYNDLWNYCQSNFGFEYSNGFELFFQSKPGSSLANGIRKYEPNSEVKDLLNAKDGNGGIDVYVVPIYRDAFEAEELVEAEFQEEGVHTEVRSVQAQTKVHCVEVEVEVDNEISDLDVLDYNSEELVSLIDSDEDRVHTEEFIPSSDFERQVELKVGLKFPSTFILRKALSSHAIENGYDFYYIHNERDRVSTFCKLRCECPFKNGKKRHQKDCEVKCLFKVHATKLVGEETFQIKSLNLKHNCGKQNINSKVTIEYLAHRYLENWRADPKWSLTAFKVQIMRDLGVEVGYHKCWFAKFQSLKMIYGNSDAEYKKVWDYCEAIRKYIHGSTCIVKLGSFSKPIPIFQRMYMCMEPCKKGFTAGCRPLIGLDGCHLKGIYPGICIVAVGQDGNNNIYPIAWAVVEIENKDTWVWFLELVLNDIGLEDHQLTIMSDRQKGLLEAFQFACPNAEIRFCVRHIYANFKQKFGGRAYKDSLWGAARATTKEEFKKQTEGLKFLKFLSNHH